MLSLLLFKWFALFVSYLFFCLLHLISSTFSTYVLLAYVALFCSRLALFPYHTVPIKLEEYRKFFHDSTEVEQEVFRRHC